MKLYIVIQQEYEDVDIAGIFDNEEKAKKVVALLRNVENENYNIMEFNLNELTSYKNQINEYLIDIYDILNVK